MLSVFQCYHEMRFKIFTEHEVELFAFHINFFNLNEFFLSICMQHTDKNVPRKWFLGAFFWYCVLQDCWSFWGFCPLDPPPGLCPGPTGGLITPPRQPATPGRMKYGYCILCLRKIPLSSICIPSRQIWPTTLNSIKKA